MDFRRKNVLGIEKNFEAEGREFSKICGRSEQFFKQNTIFNLLFEIPIGSSTFEQSKCQLDQIIATGTR